MLQTFTYCCVPYCYKLFSYPAVAFPVMHYGIQSIFFHISVVPPYHFCRPQKLKVESRMEGIWLEGDT